MANVKDAEYLKTVAAGNDGVTELSVELAKEVIRLREWITKFQAKKVVECWGFIRGREAWADSSLLNEDSLWKIKLGWPSDAEIESAKAAGASVELVQIYRK